MFFINSNYIGEETIIYFQFNCLDCTNDNFCYDFGNSVIIILWKIRSFSVKIFEKSKIFTWNSGDERSPFDWYHRWKSCCMYRKTRWPPFALNERTLQCIHCCFLNCDKNTTISKVLGMSLRFQLKVQSHQWVMVFVGGKQFWHTNIQVQCLSLVSEKKTRNAFNTCKFKSRISLESIKGWLMRL